MNLYMNAGKSNATLKILAFITAICIAVISTGFASAPDDGQVGTSAIGESGDAVSIDYTGFNAEYLVRLAKDGAVGYQLAAALRELYRQSEPILTEEGILPISNNMPLGLSAWSEESKAYFLFTVLDALTPEQASSVNGILSNHEIDAMTDVVRAHDYILAAQPVDSPGGGAAPGASYIAPVIGRDAAISQDAKVEGLTLTQSSETDEGSSQIKLLLGISAENGIKVSGADADVVLVLDNSACMGDEGKLEALKSAAKGFADSLLASAPGSKLAIVAYESPSPVDLMYGNNGKVTSTNLISVNAGGSVNSAIYSAINSLQAGDGGSYPNKGLAEAAEILNGASGGDRVVVMLAGTVPGIDSKWDIESFEAAQSTIYWSEILKNTKGVAVELDENDSFEGGKGKDFYQYTGFKSRFDSSMNGQTGLGATVYTVGLFSGDEQNSAYLGRYMSEVSSGGNGYYLTTQGNGLNDAFERVAGNMSTSLDELTVKAYIPDYLTVAPAAGNGKTGSDESGTYIEWDGIAAGSGVKMEFEAYAYLTPAEDFLGGKDVPLTAEAKAIVYGKNASSQGKIAELEGVKADIALQPFHVQDASDTVLIGDSTQSSTADIESAMFSYAYDMFGVQLEYSWDTVPVIGKVARASEQHQLTVGASLDGQNSSSGASYSLRVVTPEFADPAAQELFLGEALGVNAISSAADIVAALPLKKPNDMQSQEFSELSAYYQNEWQSHIEYRVTDQETGQDIGSLAEFVPDKSTVLLVAAEYVNSLGDKTLLFENKEITVNVSSGTITLTTEVADSDAPMDADSRFVVAIGYKGADDQETFYQVLGANETKTIVGLPGGAYDIQIVDGWSAKWDMESGGGTVTLDKGEADASMVFSAKKKSTPYLTAELGKGR